jgi:hypothetical protein
MHLLPCMRLTHADSHTSRCCSRTATVTRPFFPVSRSAEFLCVHGLFQAVATGPRCHGLLPRSILVRRQCPVLHRCKQWRCISCRVCGRGDPETNVHLDCGWASQNCSERGSTVLMARPESHSCDGYTSKCHLLYWL